MDKDTDIHGLLTALADSKDYFGLRDTYITHSPNLPLRERLYWQAVCENIFGSEYKSLVAAGKYLSEYGGRDEDSAEMLYISAINRLRRFRYRGAARTYRKLLKVHGSSMSEEELEEAGNNLMVCQALRGVPPQRVSLNGIRRIPVEKTSLGHLTARVESGGCTCNCIIDTGANFSAVSRTAAAVMGLIPAAAGIQVGTATGIRIECGLAHAPELRIGGITVHNAVFILMDDSQLDFSEIGYSIEGIIGLPVIRQLGELKITPGCIRIGNVRIPESAAGNICFEGLMPLAEIYSGGRRLTFTLDTGANQSEYSNGYYTKNREELEARATKLRGLRGGGGGVVRQKGLMVRDEKLYAGGRAMTVPMMNVIPDDYEFSRGKDGNLGLDALMSTGGFSISFRRMALYPARGKGSVGRGKK